MPRKLSTLKLRAAEIFAARGHTPGRYRDTLLTQWAVLGCKTCPVTIEIRKSMPSDPDGLRLALGPQLAQRCNTAEQRERAAARERALAEAAAQESARVRAEVTASQAEAAQAVLSDFYGRPQRPDQVRAEVRRLQRGPLTDEADRAIALELEQACQSPLATLDVEQWPT